MRMKNFSALYFAYNLISEKFFVPKLWYGMSNSEVDDLKVR